MRLLHYLDQSLEVQEWGRPQTMTTKPITFRFTVERDVVASPHDTGIALMNIANGKLFSLNSIGAQIWHGLENGQTPESILNGVCANYRVSRASASMHLDAFLAELQQQGLIRAGVE